MCWTSGWARPALPKPEQVPSGAKPTLDTCTKNIGFTANLMATFVLSPIAFNGNLYQPTKIRVSTPVMAGVDPHRLLATNCERCNPNQQPSDEEDWVKPSQSGVGSLYEAENSVRGPGGIASACPSRR